MGLTITKFDKLDQDSLGMGEYEKSMDGLWQ
jgi:hypothetical protein